MVPSIEHDEETPLHSLYVQIEYGGSDPHAVLGITFDPTDLEIKAAYRTLARRLHPDKSSGEEARLLHTKLFQIVQEAYDKLQFEASVDQSVRDPIKALPETAEALRVRNWDNRERLKAARRQALTAKQKEDALRASAQAKNEWLAKKKADRAAEAELRQKQRGEKPHVEAWRRRKPVEHGLHKDNTGYNASGNTSYILLADFGDGEDGEYQQKLRGSYSAEHARHEASLENPFIRKEKAAPSKPIGDGANSTFDRSIDEPLVKNKDVERRWNNQLLSGGTSGSVSLIEQSQKMNCAAAKRLQREMLYFKAAGKLDRAALKPGSRATFCFGSLEDILRANYEEESFGIDQEVDRCLARLDENTKSYLFLDDQEPRPMALLGDWAGWD